MRMDILALDTNRRGEMDIAVRLVEDKTRIPLALHLYRERYLIKFN